MSQKLRTIPSKTHAGAEGNQSQGMDARANAAQLLSLPPAGSARLQNQASGLARLAGPAWQGLDSRPYCHWPDLLVPVLLGAAPIYHLAIN